MAAENHPGADFVAVAGKPPATEIPIAGGIHIFAVVFALPRAGGELYDFLDAGLFGSREIIRRRQFPMPRLVHIDIFHQPPARNFRHGPNHHVLAHVQIRIIGRMVDDGIDIQSAHAAPQNKMNRYVTRVHFGILPGISPLAGNVHQVRRLRFHGKDARKNSFVAFVAIHKKINAFVPAGLADHFLPAITQRKNCRRSRLNRGADDTIGQHHIFPDDNRRHRRTVTAAARNIAARLRRRHQQTSQHQPPGDSKSPESCHKNSALV